MYCENCGAKNKSNVKFCESCGHKMPVKANDKGMSKVKREKKKLGFKQKLILVLIIIVAILLIVYFTIANFFSPENTTKKILNAISNENLVDLYSYFDLDDSAFTSKEIFIEHNKDSFDEQIFSYKVLNVEYSSDKKRAEVKVLVKYSSDDYGQTETIKLKKSGKKYLLFDNWVYDGDMTIDETEINVFAGSKVTIDGIDITEYKVDDESNNQYDVYELPTMLKDDYEISVTLPFGITVSDTMYPNSYCCNFNISISDLTDEIKSALNSTATDTLNQMYEAILSETDAKEFVSNFTSDSDYSSKFINEYNYVKNRINRWTTISKVEFTDSNITYIELDSSKIVATMSFGYKYVNEELEEETEQVNNVTITFEYVDGAFKVVTIEDAPTYFY